MYLFGSLFVTQWVHSACGAEVSCFTGESWTILVVMLFTFLQGSLVSLPPIGLAPNLNFMHDVCLSHLLISSMQVGPRSKKDRERFPPNNVLLMLAGAGLLWMGWAGFNGGDPYSANVDSSMAVLNTNICAATSLLVWTWLDVIFFKKPSVIGAVQGMITGLVSITPGAGINHPSTCMPRRTDID